MTTPDLYPIAVKNVRGVIWITTEDVERLTGPLEAFVANFPTERLAENGLTEEVRAWLLRSLHVIQSRVTPD